ncbi:hypothetical protein ACFL4P_01750 [Gemmatimonadota bacterium]
MNSLIISGKVIRGQTILKAVRAAEREAQAKTVVKAEREAIANRIRFKIALSLFLICCYEIKGLVKIYESFYLWRAIRYYSRTFLADIPEDLIVQIQAVAA